MRILIAEDDRDLNQLIKRKLKEADYSVDACFDGEEVFDYLLGAEYDVLVLDIMMPKLDGHSSAGSGCVSEGNAGARAAAHRPGQH